MQAVLGKAFTHALDGENNPVEFDFAYPLRGDIQTAVEQLRARHGDDLLLLPMSGTSSGGGIFQYRGRPRGRIIGLRFDPPVEPSVQLGAVPDLGAIRLDEIRIDPDRQQICAGAAITLHQLNQALANELGPGFKVPGADLTSYMYAAVGATFMTGGMGPQRRYFSDSVIEAAIYDGARVRALRDDALSGYAGTYGWSGTVTAVRCEYFRFPDNEIAFALPVSHAPDELAALLAQLAPFAFIRFEHRRAASLSGDYDLILGIEHVSRASMTPLLRDHPQSESAARARALAQKCDAIDADGLIFVNGYSDRSIDDFLFGLVDDRTAQEFSIAGIDLEYAEVFDDGEEMRALREAVPYAARMQQPGGRLVYKNHSDANIRLPADRVAPIMLELWQISRDYVAGIERHFADSPGVNGEILVYGHLNPFGVDPHNRVTLGSDDEAAFEKSRKFLLDARAGYYRALADLCRSSGAEFVGGEKTADSEIAIFRALGGPEQAPEALRRRYAGQAARVRAAAPMFNWRAPSPYR